MGLYLRHNTIHRTTSPPLRLDTHFDSVISLFSSISIHRRCTCVKANVFNSIINAVINNLELTLLEDSFIAWLWETEWLALLFVIHNQNIDQYHSINIYCGVFGALWFLFCLALASSGLASTLLFRLWVYLVRTGFWFGFVSFRFVSRWCVFIPPIAMRFRSYQQQHTHPMWILCAYMRYTKIY